jgi:hypothetical protein
MHSPSKTERLWFAHLLESQSLPKPDDAPLVSIGTEQKRRIHGLLARSEVFDNFLQLKFPNLKRYGLEGGESMLPALDSLFAAAAQAGVQHVMLGLYFFLSYQRSQLMSLSITFSYASPWPSQSANRHLAILPRRYVPQD